MNRLIYSTPRTYKGIFGIGIAINVLGIRIILNSIYQLDYGFY
jgi:hypothetical protein